MTTMTVPFDVLHDPQILRRAAHQRSCWGTRRTYASPSDPDERNRAAIVRSARLDMVRAARTANLQDLRECVQTLVMLLLAIDASIDLRRGPRPTQLHQTRDLVLVDPDDLVTTASMLSDTCSHALSTGSNLLPVTISLAAWIAII